jgi:hypothetical protein
MVSFKNQKIDKMTNTVAKIYVSFIALLAIGMITFMCIVDFKGMIPSLIGLPIFILIIYTFYKVMSKKSEEDQRRITIRNGKISYVGIFVLLAVFFIAGANHFNIPVLDFVRLWFNF